ncbi:MAG: cobalt-precorrin-5B (C(1))-methyltransferase [Actinobacteria bacterium]|nr:cobalt-precorrin-5B (C(1))-methyltransferase [Actinomycetota bacterium]MBW3650339.1 cobalt-precorrin-5B (C(1))-methyltransferase [Actinomycetota bacterium]
MTTHEPPLSPDVARRNRGLRTGWTTGTCAAAAAKAAVTGLVAGVAPRQVDIALPGGRRVGFGVEVDGEAARCVVVKDAGDDPDCTDGARMTAQASWAATGATELLAGPGVGTITKPGLGLDVGAPAINPVPRTMILAAVAEVTDRPVSLTFSVPGGEEMAARTSNARLGILGGISILGTTGIVRPFSTAAYRASVVQQVDVAAAQGERTIVMATGSRSEQAAMRICDVPEVCIVEVGDFTGIALRRAAAAGMRGGVFVGMAGKITKLAAGVMMTHFHRSKVDGELLAEAARAAGAPAAVVEAATATATARHFFEVCVHEGCIEPLRLVCEQARAACVAHVGGALDIEVVMVDFDGREVVARAA